MKDQERVLKRILNGLTSKGVCIFTAGGVDEFDEITNSYMGPAMYCSSLGLRKMLEIILDAECMCRHLEYDQYPESHAYFIVQRG